MDYTKMDYKLHRLLKSTGRKSLKTWIFNFSNTNKRRHTLSIFRNKRLLTLTLKNPVYLKSLAGSKVVVQGSRFWGIISSSGQRTLRKVWQLTKPVWDTHFVMCDTQRVLTWSQPLTWPRAMRYFRCVTETVSVTFFLAICHATMRFNLVISSDLTRNLTLTQPDQKCQKSSPYWRQTMKRT